MAARASSEIRPNEAEEGGFVISFPIFSSIETEQHERRDNEAQRRCHEQPRYIETDQEKDGHEEHAQPAPEDFASVKKKISGASCPQPDRTLQLIRVERIRRKRTFFQQRVRRKTRILVPTARENLIQKPRHTGFQKGFFENNSVVFRVHAKTIQFSRTIIFSGESSGCKREDRPKRLMTSADSADYIPWPHRNSIPS